MTIDEILEQKAFKDSSFVSSLIGIAILSSNFIYAIIVALLALYWHPPVNPMPENSFSLIAYIMLPVGIITALPSLFLGPVILKAQRKPNAVSKATESTDEIIKQEFGAYLVTSIILASIAHAPAIYALVLSLLALMTYVSIIADTIAFAIIIFLNLLSLCTMIVVIPTGSRLEDHMRRWFEERQQ
ncbi:MAG: hypothetical protein JXR97_02070 [Planctomycetes bacterium]|nr:hypothetical protein [Planctomycetota bacterium]